MDRSMPGFPVLIISWSLLKLMSIESMMLSNQLTLCRPPLLLPLIFPSIRVFSNELFISGGQSIGASASVLLTNIQSWLPLGLTCWISCCPRDSQVSSPAPQYETISSSMLSLLYGPTLTLYVTTGNTIALTIQTSVGKIMSLLFNMLSRFVIAFLPRSKCLLISWLQSTSMVTLEPKEIKSVTVSISSPSCFFTIGAS